MTVVPMTPEAACLLKERNIPQQFAACVRDERWTIYELGAERVDRSIFVHQLIADLSAYTNDRKRALAIPAVDRIAMKAGFVVALLDSCGKRLPEPEMHLLVTWINRELRIQRPPVVAVSEDAQRIRLLYHPDNHMSLEMFERAQRTRAYYETLLSPPFTEATNHIHRDPKTRIER